MFVYNVGECANKACEVVVIALHTTLKCTPVDLNTTLVSLNSTVVSLNSVSVTLS